MLIRLILFLTLLLLGVSGAGYLLTRDMRYLQFAARVGRFLVFLLLVFGALYALERYGLVAWRVFA